MPSTPDEWQTIPERFKRLWNRLDSQLYRDSGL